MRLLLFAIIVGFILICPVHAADRNDETNKKSGVAGDNEHLAITITVLTVHDYPQGDGPENLVSNGIPFKPGFLYDERKIKVMDGTTDVPIATKVLAYWVYDNSIRSLLVQFNADFTGKVKDYTIGISEQRATPDIQLTPVTWDLPKKIVTLPAQYLCNSLVVWEQKPLGKTGFSEWEQKQLNNYHVIKNVGTVSCANQDQYYDSIHTTYQMYARTGRFEYLVNGRKWALHHRRDQIYLDGDLIGHGKCTSWENTRYTYVEGLIDDYFLWGDEESKSVSGLVADHFYMSHDDKWYYKAPGERGSWTEREPAFALIGLIRYFEATNDRKYLDKVKERVDVLYKMQVDNGGTAWVHNLYDHDPEEGCNVNDWGSSPWMSGLLLEGIIQYHKLTGDANAEKSIFMALDYLKRNCLATTGRNAGKSFVYIGCPKHTVGHPDLDNLISHAYAYGYRLSNYTRRDYLALAIDLFNTSVRYGNASDSKQFNQQFRTSGHTLAYIMPAALPMMAISGFSATVGENEVTLLWHTEANTDVGGFIVYRSDTRDGNYLRLSFVNGIGDSGKANNYQYIDKEVQPSRTYYYCLEGINASGNRGKIDAIRVTLLALASDALQPVALPARTELLDNYPNPFSYGTWIPYNLSRGASVTIQIYDTQLHPVRTLHLGYKPAGSYLGKDKSAYWDGQDSAGKPVSNGNYLYSLNAGDFSDIRKMTVQK